MILRTCSKCHAFIRCINEELRGFTPNANLIHSQYITLLRHWIKIFDDKRCFTIFVLSSLPTVNYEDLNRGLPFFCGMELMISSALYVDHFGGFIKNPVHILVVDALFHHSYKFFLQCTFDTGDISRILPEFKSRTLYKNVQNPLYEYYINGLSYVCNAMNIKNIPRNTDIRKKAKFDWDKLTNGR